MTDQQLAAELDVEIEWSKKGPKGKRKLWTATRRKLTLKEIEP
jgi:hypothetical protein